MGEEVWAGANVTTALTRRSTVVWTSASQTREWQSAFQTTGTITQKLHAVSAPREDIQDSDATMVLVSTDGNAATDGSSVLMLAMRWTASGVSALEFLCLGMPGRPRTVVPVTPRRWGWIQVQHGEVHLGILGLRRHLRVPGRLRRGQGLSACRGERRDYNIQAGDR